MVSLKLAIHRLPKLANNSPLCSHRFILVSEFSISEQTFCLTSVLKFSLIAPFL